MSEKRTILNQLVTHIKGINGQVSTVIGCPFSPYTYKINLSNNVFSKLVFLDEINDFPTIMLYQDNIEQRQYNETGNVLGSVSLRLRAYVYQDEGYKQIDDLIEDMQYAINSFKYTIYDNANLYDVRITQVSTDEGLMDPYGLAEISFTLVYKLNI